MPYKDPEKQREAVRRSQAKRRAALKAVDEAEAVGGDLSDPPDRDELLKILGKRARQGNVPAARQLLEEYRRDADSSKDTRAGSVFDELAQRRARRAG